MEATKQRYVFPFSFDSAVHLWCQYQRQMGDTLTRDWPHYTLKTPLGVLSVVGGDQCCGWMGDGIHTFEAWFPGESDPRTVTADEINDWLALFG